MVETRGIKRRRGFYEESSSKSSSEPPWSSEDESIPPSYPLRSFPPFKLPRLDVPSKSSPTGFYPLPTFPNLNGKSPLALKSILKKPVSDYPLSPSELPEKKTVHWEMLLSTARYIPLRSTLSRNELWYEGTTSHPSVKETIAEENLTPTEQVAQLRYVMPKEQRLAMMKELATGREEVEGWGHSIAMTVEGPRWVESRASIILGEMKNMESFMSSQSKVNTQVENFFLGSEVH
ncbi:hypothetical protein M501DRAFT_985337 [Patellaria atrata CBS 101060]|uniref:Uncharacterized protein n=1 Tax=Patellaria atrata CBS 101060 TaxID=1346257 RepID=A0A9P4VV57_9PEZI|nr:hypothetical protein M501DRAFT_985337 [Patellaria atrata CBS 101060]